MPIQLPENLPMTKELQFLIYAFLIVAFISFFYKSIVKDIIIFYKNKKNKKAQQEEDVHENYYCEDEFILNHQFFKLMYRYIRVDLSKIFDINMKKDAQFYLLGKCKFIIYYRFLKELAAQSVEGYVIYKGEKIDKIDFKIMLDMHETAVSDYSKMFLDNGGNAYVLEKFMEYSRRRNAGINEMFGYLTEQEFFSKDLRNTVMALLNLYTYLFVQIYEDLKEDHKKINGSILSEMEKFILTEEFKMKAKMLDVK